MRATHLATRLRAARHRTQVLRGLMVNKQPSDLAVFGGPRAFCHPVYVGAPNLGDRASLHRRLDEALDRRWLTNDGLFLQEFEHRMAALLGVRHFIAICNATVALEILLRACGLEGDVIVPSFTFVATAHAPRWLGLTPVFCDIDERTHTLDPARVEELITPRTSAILGVHLWGRPCDVEALQGLSQRHGLRLLFDAAHAFGVSRGGVMLANFGDAEVFSFHATKFFNTFEGGAITTNDDDLAARARLKRNFGFSGYDTVVTDGTNGKMSEVCAAMGLTSLESMDAFVAHNRRNYEAYRRALSGLNGVCLLEFDEGEQSNYQYVVVELGHEYSGPERDLLVETLHAENVMARRYFYPGIHRMEPYRTLHPRAGDRLPVTEHVADRVIVLPTGTAVGRDDVQTISELLCQALERLPEIKAQLSQPGS
jgi:dTDP-4-amino-4,6-dideoxygalactose transaminase